MTHHKGVNVCHKDCGWVKRATLRVNELRETHYTKKRGGDALCKVRLLLTMIIKLTDTIIAVFET